MKTVQIIKNVNNTELGKGATHEYYILVPKKLDVSELFPIPNEIIAFYDPIKKKSYEIRLTIGQEKRIVGLGPFYRDYDVSAGDDVILQKTIINGKVLHKIRCHKHSNSIVLSKIKDGFEVLTPERMSLMSEKSTIRVGSETKKIKLKYIKSVRKRTDSPVDTNVYDLVIDEQSVSDKYFSNTIELVVNNETVSVVTSIAWKKQIIQSED